MLRCAATTTLVWLTVYKATLKNHRNAYEYRVLVQLAEASPVDVTVLIVADCGVGDDEKSAAGSWGRAGRARTDLGTGRGGDVTGSRS